MPRPNRPRSVLAEVNLAQRVAHERAARGWSPEGLARRMADVGCPINVSAIYRIEQADPPRRITVDELVGFSRVFAVPVDELLVPPEIAVSGEVTRRVVLWSVAHDAMWAAVAERDAAWAGLVRYVEENPAGLERAEDMFRSWAEEHRAEELRVGTTAYWMWRLTGREEWLEAAKADVNRG